MRIPGARCRLTRGALRVHPGGVWATYHRLLETQWLDPAELDRLRLEALRDLLDAARSVPFHRERLHAAGLDPARIEALSELAALPPLERDELQRLGVEGLRRPGSRGMRVETSGSSGRPVEVLRPLSLIAFVKAADLRARDWHGIGPAEHRLHITGSRMGRRRRIVSALENTRLHHVIRPPGSDSTVAGFARSLRRVPPALVTGGVGPLSILAGQLIDAGVSIPARVVWSGAGMLHEPQRQTVERAFGASVYQRYGAWETGLIGQECPEGRSLHLLAENVIVEVVRPDGEPAATGEVGEVLVTTLCNHAMPMIRYRLGDLAALAAEPCSCGRGLPVLRSLVGRTNELLVTGDGAYVTPEDVGNHVMTAVAASVVEFQIEQHADCRVDVKVVQRDDPPPAAFRERIAAALDGMLRAPGTTRVERVDEIPLERSGKLRHIVSHAGPRTPGESA
ncbi:MAG: hypothetical protein U0R69_13610 [Gaiellales bacterium]